MNEKPIIITMLKPSLNDIINSPLPKGYHIRNFKQGDRDIWIKLYNSLDEYYFVTAKDFDESFGTKYSLLEQGMFFLCYKDKEVGTITAWPEEDIDGKKTSRLHWAGVNKNHRGKHLGSALVSYILTHMKKQGCESCVLSTNEKRLPALHMYFKFGFVPVLLSDTQSPISDQKESWSRVCEHISHEYKDKISF